MGVRMKLMLIANSSNKTDVKYEERKPETKREDGGRFMKCNHDRKYSERKLEDVTAI